MCSCSVCFRCCRVSFHSCLVLLNSSIFWRSSICSLTCFKVLVCSTRSSAAAEGPREYATSVELLSITAKLQGLQNAIYIGSQKANDRPSTSFNYDSRSLVWLQSTQAPGDFLLQSIMGVIRMECGRMQIRSTWEKLRRSRDRTTPIRTYMEI